MDIAEFLEARIGEDEQLAQAAIDDDCGQDGGFEDAYESLTAGPEKAGPLAHVPRIGEAAARIIVWATPRRILAECAAKRAIIKQHEAYATASPESVGIAWVGARSGQEATTDALQALAAVYADHPDYQQEWVA
jgi:hypothetical protein